MTIPLSRKVKRITDPSKNLSIAEGISITGDGNIVINVQPSNVRKNWMTQAFRAFVSIIVGSIVSHIVSGLVGFVVDPPMVNSGAAVLTYVAWQSAA